ncbi:hypothetical protein EWI61_06130 [Methylolobus aquaticus]|nr:hypothetical protein EWI61_06130 [Methylolobus aquaticus]
MTVVRIPGEVLGALFWVTRAKWAGFLQLAAHVAPSDAHPCRWSQATTLGSNPKSPQVLDSAGSSSLSAWVATAEQAVLCGQSLIQHSERLKDALRQWRRGSQCGYRAVDELGLRRRGAIMNWFRVTVVSTIVSGTAMAATGDLPIPGPLSAAVRPPMDVRVDGVAQRAGIGSLIKDNRAAIKLGKVLFWDTQVGSDGVACATCHYHAGSDHRTRNQINPATLRTVQSMPGAEADPLSTVFDPLWITPRSAPSLGAPSGPNANVKRDNFPLYWRDGPPGPTGRWEVTDDVMASQGSFGG